MHTLNINLTVDFNCLTVVDLMTLSIFLGIQVQSNN